MPSQNDTVSCRHCCIKVSGMTVAYGKKVGLDGVELHIHCGEVIAVVGPNGAGKTTLLRAILGEVPYRGRMEFLQGARPRKPRIGDVPQKIQVDPDSPISVMDLVVAAISPRPVWLGVSRALAIQAGDVLKRFSAEHLSACRIGDLSGGELQRVLLAIAMTKAPELLLLDEPGTGVDMQGLALFYKLVRDLRERHDISVIIVTHDLAGISPYVDRIVLLDHTIIAQGSPAEVLSNDAMIRAFGPGLWNVSSLPEISSGKGNP